MLTIVCLVEQGNFFSCKSVSCDSPNLIKNPYYKKNPRLGLNFLHDCSSQYMRVPCGHCPSCIATKQMYKLQRFYMQSLDSYVYFSTFTYDNKHLPSLEVNGFTIRYANFKHFTDMVKRIRVNNSFTRPFSYFAVSELGSARGRPHFHCLWFLPRYSSDSDFTPYKLESILYKVLFDSWSINLGSKRSPVYEPLFEFHSIVRNGKVFSNFDTHFVRPVLGSAQKDSVAFYVMKYLLKGSSRERKLQQALRLNLDPQEYSEIWNTVKSQSRSSLFFGYGFNPYCLDCCERCSAPSPSVVAYIKDCIKKTPVGSPYPCFFSPLDGSSYPLAPFYQGRSIFYSLDDALPILLNSRAPVETSLDDDFFQKSKLHFQKFQKTLRDSELHGNPILFD